MEKIIDGMCYTFGSSIILLPIFYVCSVQLMKCKKEIVATSMNQFTNNLFGNLFQPPPHRTTVIKDDFTEEKPTEITSFFMKKRGVATP